MPKGTISVRLDQETLDRLGMIARATGRSRGALMAHAIEKYTDTEVWQVAAIQGAVDDLARGDAGLVDHADVAGWLGSWGLPDELEPPA
jgi:predicted transcriptional regulator